MSETEPNFWGRVVRGYGRVKDRRAANNSDKKNLKGRMKVIEDQAYELALRDEAVRKGILRAKEGNGLGAKLAKIKKFSGAASKTFAPAQSNEKKGNPLDFM